MPTLTIEGRRVNVTDSFLQLSPEMQSQTVDEIAASLGVQGAGSRHPKDPRFEQTFAAAEAGRGNPAELFAQQMAGMDQTDLSVARSKNTPLGGYLRQQAEMQQPGENADQMQHRQSGGLAPRPAHDSAADKARTFAYNVINGVPIIGEKVADNVAAAGVYLANPEQGFDKSFEAAQALSGQDAADNPYTAIAGNITGGVASMLPIGATGIGAKALGMSGGLGTRIGLSGASSAGISGGDTLARGGSVSEAGEAVLKSGGIGAGLPIAGAVARGIGRFARDKTAPLINGLANPTKEAGRRIGQALNADDFSATRRMTPADEAVAAANGQPVVNADRGGEQTLSLVRSITNQSPKAREIIASFAGDRYAGQGDRAKAFLSRIMADKLDDLAYQDSIKGAAQRANAPAYKKAFNAPAAQAMWNSGLQRLMQAPAMQSAAKGAAGRGANRAAVEGFKPIRNPFTFADDGTFTLSTAKGGAQAVPTLQFWDQTKRNLDGMIGQAQRTGDKTLAADLAALKNALVGELDGAVPAYKAARKGASAFFDADDAIGAGRKFVNLTRRLPETKRALMRMNPAERNAFAIGFASELKDKIMQAGDSVDLTKRIFGSDEARQKIALALGPERFKQFEGFIRVEGTLKALKDALGNSTTVQQLIGLGAAGGVAGFSTSGGDIPTAVASALVASGARYGITKANDRTLKAMAEILMSDSPQQMGALMRRAAGNDKTRKTLANIGLIARAINIEAQGGDREPLRIDVPVGRASQ